MVAAVISNTMNGRLDMMLEEGEEGGEGRRGDRSAGYRTEQDDFSRKGFWFFPWNPVSK